MARQTCFTFGVSIRRAYHYFETAPVDFLLAELPCS